MILALGASLSVISRGSADAHSCGLPSRFDVGRVGNVTVGVAAEERPVTAVDIVAPAGFRLDAAAPAKGWTSSRDGLRLHYQGGPIYPYNCGFFTLTGLIAKKGVYAFEVTTHADDGSVRQYTARDPIGPNAAQLVLAGVDSLDDADGEGGGTNWLTVAGGVLAVAALTAGAITVVQRRVPVGRGRR